MVINLQVLDHLTFCKNQGSERITLGMKFLKLKVCTDIKGLKKTVIANKVLEKRAVSHIQSSYVRICAGKVGDIAASCHINGFKFIATAVQALHCRIDACIKIA